MSKTKVDPNRLRDFIDAGHTQADAARYFGVSQTAIHQRLKHMRRLTSHVIALEKAGTLVDESSTPPIGSHASSRLSMASWSVPSKRPGNPE